jgi:hypothetical protein
MADPNEIDIQLNLASALSGAAFDNFVRQVSSIEQSMKAMTQHNAKLAQQANRATSDNFGGAGRGGAGPSRSGSSGGGLDQERGSGPSKQSSRSEQTPIESLLDATRLGNTPWGKKAGKVLGGHVLDSGQGLSDAGVEYAVDNEVKPFKVWRDRKAAGMGTQDALLLSAGAVGRGVNNRLAGRRITAMGVSNAMYGYQMFARPWLQQHVPQTSPVQEGQNLGFDRQDWSMFGESGPAGFQLPILGRYFSHAGWKGIEERFNRVHMRLRAGINGEQADAIQSALYEQGLTGGDFRDRAEDAMTRLTQRFPGVNQQLTAQMMMRGTRYGTANVEDVADNIERLGEAAKESSMTMEQLQQSVNEASQVLTAAVGGTDFHNQQRATGWFEATGMDPSVGTRLAQNGYVQAMTLSQTGLPSFAQGLLPGSSANSMASSAAIDLVNNLGGNAGGSRTMRDPTTGFNMDVSNEEYAINQAAPMLGMTPDELTELYRNAHTDKQKFRTQGFLDQYVQSAHELTRDPDDPFGLDEADRIVKGGPREKDQIASWNEVKDEALKIKDDDGKSLITKSDLKHVEDDHTGVRKFGPFTIEHRSSEELAKERRAALEDLIAKRSKERQEDTGGKGSDTSVSIDLTDDAKKLIKARATTSKSSNRDEKDRARAGGTPYTDATDGKSILSRSDRKFIFGEDG